MLAPDSWLALAELPSTSGYFHPVKVGTFAVLALLWAAVGAWVDQDTIRVRTPRLPWNAAVFGAGGLGLALWILLPGFALGLIVFLVFFGGSSIGYVVFRNGRVAPAQRVLTPRHVIRVMGRKTETEESVHAGDRVRIKGADGKQPKWPTDPEQHDGYRALQDLLFDAVWRRTSMVDLTITAQVTRIVYRIDGVNRDRDPIDRGLAEMAVAQLKRIAGMDPAEVRKPQGGKFQGFVGPGGKQDKSVEFVVKASGSTAGQRVVVQLHSEESRFRIPDVGLTKAQLAVVEPMVEALSGLVIVAGPRESGVTSTLYAMLRSHDAFMRNIHTLEMAKSMDVENITQHVFDSKGSEVSYGRQLQSILRMDPDIVMASDCPDRETAELIAGSARQNRKIYLGMAAPDTFAALRRYLQLVGEGELAAAGLQMAMAQRLVRVLCANCRRAYKPDPMLLKKANLPMDENRPFYRPPNPNEVETDKRGNPLICQVCQGSGYLGRTGIFEILQIDEDIRSMVASGAPLQNVKAHARKKRMQYLQEAGLQKVYDGITSINEVLRVTKEDEAAPRPTASHP